MSLFEEKRIKNDQDNETVVFQHGYAKGSGDLVWFCVVSMRGLCVEDYAQTKRTALRLARRAWRKEQRLVVNSVDIDRQKGLFGGKNDLENRPKGEASRND